MIGYIEGTLLHQDEDKVLVLAQQIGYEILVPAFVMETLKGKSPGDPVRFHVFFQQTERQPRPLLIGFNSLVEKEFFQRFVSVEDIGPLKAVKALTLPVRDVARAIEQRDLACLQKLRGIGARTAQKILATLEGKMAKFALMQPGEPPASAPVDDMAKQVLDVLVDQLGYRMVEARRMIADAFKRNPHIASPEALFEEVYRGEPAP